MSGRPRHPRVANVDLGERYDVYCGRNPRWGPTDWGNYAAKYSGRPLDAEGAVAAYCAGLLARPAMIERARALLPGRVLGCHCARRTWSPPCHCEPLADVSEAETHEGAVVILEALAKGRR